MIKNRKLIKKLICGAGRDRTDDLLTASQALSQLSYGPFVVNKRNKVNHTTIFVGSIYVAPEAIK